MGEDGGREKGTACFKMIHLSRAVDKTGNQIDRTAQQAAEFTCLNMSGKERPSFQKYPLTSVLRDNTHINSDLESKVRLRECKKCVFSSSRCVANIHVLHEQTRLCFYFVLRKFSVTQVRQELTLKCRLPSSLLQSFHLLLLRAGITGMHSYA